MAERRVLRNNADTRPRSRPRPAEPPPEESPAGASEEALAGVPAEEALAGVPAEEALADTPVEQALADTPVEQALADAPAEQAQVAGAPPEEALAGTPVEQAPVEPLLDSAASAADRLNALLARLQEDPQLAPAAEYLKRLSDEAQAEAHARGIRALAQTLPHAFGQPLSEILGYAELLRAGQYSAAEQGEMLGQIERASARLGQTMRAVARLADSHLGQPRWRVSGGRELVELELPAVEPRPGEPTALAELRQSALRQVADTQSGPTSEP